MAGSDILSDFLCQHCASKPRLLENLPFEENHRIIVDDTMTLENWSPIACIKRLSKKLKTKRFNDEVRTSDLLLSIDTLNAELKSASEIQKKNVIDHKKQTQDINLLTSETQALLLALKERVTEQKAKVTDLIINLENLNNENSKLQENVVLLNDSLRLANEELTDKKLEIHNVNKVLAEYKNVEKVNGITISKHEKSIKMKKTEIVSLQTRLKELIISSDKSDKSNKAVIMKLEEVIETQKTKITLLQNQLGELTISCEQNKKANKVSVLKLKEALETQKTKLLSIEDCLEKLTIENKQSSNTNRILISKLEEENASLQEHLGELTQKNLLLENQTVDQKIQSETEIRNLVENNTDNIEKISSLQKDLKLSTDELENQNLEILKIRRALDEHIEEIGLLVNEKDLIITSLKDIIQTYKDIFTKFQFCFQELSNENFALKLCVYHSKYDLVVSTHNTFKNENTKQYERNYDSWTEWEKKNEAKTKTLRFENNGQLFSGLTPELRDGRILRFNPCHFDSIFKERISFKRDPSFSNYDLLFDQLSKYKSWLERVNGWDEYEKIEP
ncbi:hypothetical protein HK096_002436 [Nowakowskiella sp. JEL0078]|nr:hypothetical protein HK096_002436 [Nowakowskiella sp. JEL0078]